MSLVELMNRIAIYPATKSSKPAIAQPTTQPQSKATKYLRLVCKLGGN